MKIILSKPSHQFAIGMIVNLFFLILFCLFKESYNNLQSPVGIYQNNIWQNNDYWTYVTSGINFARFGVFGDKNIPDYFRPIGYPAVISLFYYLFNDDWLFPLIIFQCVCFALIYPITTAIAKLILPKSSKQLIAYIFIALLVSGSYSVHSLMIMTDIIFTIFFTIGIYSGLRAYKGDGALFFIAYIGSITIAALIRPTLTLFPILNILVAFFIARRYNLSFQKLLNKALLTTLVFFLTCNISSIRNYINYSFASPSSVIGINAFNYLTKDIYAEVQKEDEFIPLEKKIKLISDITLQTKTKETILAETIFKYPSATCKVLIKNAIGVLFDNNLTKPIGQYFGYDWKGVQNGTYHFKKSTFCFYATYALMGVYFLLWIFFLFFLFRSINKGYEYIILYSAMFALFLIPSILTGHGGSRLRLPIETFFIIFSVYQIELFVKNMIMYLRGIKIQSWNTAMGAPINHPV